MATIYVSAEQLCQMNPAATCCDCPTQAVDSSPEEIWTIWNEANLYCPKCAASASIGPEEEE